VKKTPVGVLAETVTLLDRRSDNDEHAGEDLGCDQERDATDLTAWIDALALTLAAGIRVGERGLSPHPTGLAANDESIDGDGVDDVLTVEDVAALLKVGRNAIYEAVGRNEVPCRRIGKQIRFSRRGIMRWLASWSLQGAQEGT
jgi:excisionase family DNA binding protein